MNFTNKAVARLAPPKAGRTVIHDDQVPTLGLAVYASGVKSFCWFRRVNGRGTFRTIGEFPATSVDVARDAARENDARLSEWKRGGYAGPSPFDQRRDEPTFQQVVDDYIARHLPHTANPARMQTRLRQQVDRYLKQFKNRKLSAIQRRELIDLHAQLGETRPYVANRVIATVKILYNWARDTEAYSGENVAERIHMFPEKRRDRFLAPDELARLFRALQREPNQDYRDVVLLALWTGARREDLLTMRWEDLRLEDNTWRVPQPKNQTPYLVPLTSEAVNILKRRPRVAGSPWVFPSYGKTGHLAEVKSGFRRITKAAGIRNLRFHDLRRTLGSWQAAQGTSLPIIGKSLGHASVGATQIYARLDLDPVRESVAAANKAMRKAMNKKPKQLPA